MNCAKNEYSFLAQFSTNYKILTMKYFFCLVFFVTFVLACNTEQTYQTDYEVVNISEETLPPVKPLKLEKINVQEDYLMGAMCFVYHDTVLLVVKTYDPYPLTHMVTIVNMNTNTKIGEYITRGEGPNEILSTLPYFGNNTLDIQCVYTRKAISFNVDSAMALGSLYQPRIIVPEENIYLTFRTFDDSLLIAENMYYFDGCDKFRTDPALPQYYYIDKKGKYIPDFKKSDYDMIKFMPGNCTGGAICVNRAKNRFVSCYGYQPVIKVYDTQLNQIRQINGPEPNDAEYTLEADGFTLFFNRKNGVCHYYNGSYYDDECIFVQNLRNYKWKRTKEGETYSQLERETTELFKLDWDGNVIERYSAKGFTVLPITYSKTTNTLYLYLSDEFGEVNLYKAKLD